MTDNFDVSAPPPAEGSNRLFIIVAAIMGGVLIIAVVALLVYAFVLAPRLRAGRTDQVATISAQNTAVAMSVTQTAGAHVRPTLPPTHGAGGPPPEGRSSAHGQQTRQPAQKYNDESQESPRRTQGEGTWFS